MHYRKWGLESKHESAVSKVTWEHQREDIFERCCEFLIKFSAVNPALSCHEGISFQINSEIWFLEFLSKHKLKNLWWNDITLGNRCVWPFCYSSTPVSISFHNWCLNFDSWCVNAAINILSICEMSKLRSPKA